MAAAAADTSHVTPRHPLIRRVLATAAALALAALALVEATSPGLRATAVAAAPAAVAAADRAGTGAAEEQRRRQRPGRSLAVGAQFHGVWSSYSDAERAEVLDKLAAMGAGWVRVDMSWAMIQPERGRIDPSSWGVQHTEKVITMAHERGLKVLGMFWLTPPWADPQAGERSVPARPAQYGEALAWAARRWAGKVRAWEVWNEPNSGDFLAGADPRAYTRLLCAAHDAVRASGSKVRIVFGGTMYNDARWIDRAYEAGAAGCFDVMATHPYVAPADHGPSVAARTMYDFGLGGVRAVMREHGDRSPVWVTELGWSSHRNHGWEEPWQLGVTEAEQARYSVEALRLLEERYPYVRKAFFYTDRAQPGTSEHLAGYGLMREDLAVKPVWRALRAHLTS